MNMLYLFHDQLLRAKDGFELRDIEFRVGVAQTPLTRIRFPTSLLDYTVVNVEDEGCTLKTWLLNLERTYDGTTYSVRLNGGYVMISSQILSSFKLQPPPFDVTQSTHITTKPFLEEIGQAADTLERALASKGMKLCFLLSDYNFPIIVNIFFFFIMLPLIAVGLNKNNNAKNLWNFYSTLTFSTSFLVGIIFYTFGQLRKFMRDWRTFPGGALNYEYSGNEKGVPIPRENTYSLIAALRRFSSIVTTPSAVRTTTLTTTEKENFTMPAAAPRSRSPI
ncbi:MAG: hypothetical protein ACD_45C00392G0001 [uncultured bacterium]|nr:MAG: hypothetical protein ACD_45C00392G0001 [uncultured bacterium]